MNKVFMIPEIAKKIAIQMTEYEDFMGMTTGMKEVQDLLLLEYLFDRIKHPGLAVLEGRKSYCTISIKENFIVHGGFDPKNVSVDFVEKSKLKKETMAAIIDLQNRQSLMITVLNKIQEDA